MHLRGSAAAQRVSDVRLRAKGPDSIEVKDLFDPIEQLMKEIN